MFRRVFQDISECRVMLICCLADDNLITLRKIIEFWLSNKKKRAHLSLLWNVFEHMKWIENADRVIMMRRDLDFRRAEALIQDTVLMRWSKMISFIIMIRAFIDYENLIPWITRTLSSIRSSTKMNVTEVTSRENRWDTKLIVIIEELAAEFDMFIPITILTQKTSQDQLEIAIVDWTAAMFIFQPAIRNVNRIAIAKTKLSNVEYETAIVIIYKTVDTFCLVISDSSFTINVSLILKSSSEGSRCDWSDNSHVFMRVISNEHLVSDTEHEVIKKRNARLKW